MKINIERKEWVSWNLPVDISSSAKAVVFKLLNGKVSYEVAANPDQKYVLGCLDERIHLYIQLLT